MVNNHDHTRLVTTGEAARAPKVHPRTLRRWHADQIDHPYGHNWRRSLPLGTSNRSGASYSSVTARRGPVVVTHEPNTVDLGRTSAVSAPTRAATTVLAHRTARDDTHEPLAVLGLIPEPRSTP
jgi:hypothetical protein